MYTYKHVMPEKQAGREITMRVKKIIATGIVTMTMFAMTACQGSASNQTADGTNVESTVQTATKTQLQTQSATKAPETTKADEKNTVTQTVEATQAATQAVTVASEAAAEVPAQSVTEEAASASNSIDYTGFKRGGAIQINPQDLELVNAFIESFGVREISKNDFLDLNTVSCFSNLPDELKEFIYIKVSNKLNDFSADTTIGKFISNSDTMQMAFRYDPENNEFFLTTKR